jgi:hypothetical protein
MAQTIAQNTAADLLVVLTNSGGLPVTGLIFSDVTAQLRKEGEPAFTAFPLTALNFSEIGNGVYVINLTPTNTNTLGSLTLTADAATTTQFVSISTVQATPVATTAPTMPTCTITGVITDLTGEPVEGASINAKIIGIPSVENNNVAVTDELISAATDANGNFSIALLRLADVEITIPKVNYRRQLVVPNTPTANLFYIP